MIADLFIKRPKFAIVIAILMILAGGICLKQLPIAEYPEIAPTSINVQARYTGLTGFAFGIGLDRLAMIRWGIRDIRALIENDVRFLAQFQ